MMGIPGGLVHKAVIGLLVIVMVVDMALIASLVGWQLR